ncbi:MAG: hypothetical protein EPN22_13825 [Nitrospirae bacterium]|nr:MAG: hypothetical protein EPN22_13825 [Nitrospirota bacterium]
MKNENNYFFRGPLPFLVVSLLVIMVISVAGRIYYLKYRDIIKNEAGKTLSSIADLKTKQIETWYMELLSDAAVVYENPMIIDGVRKMVRNPSLPLKQDILRWMESTKKNYSYRNVFLLDPAGKMVLTTNREEQAVEIDVVAALDAIKTGKIRVSDLHSEDGVGYIHLDIVVPLLVNRNGASLPAGVLVLRIDPNKYLYPLISLWPVPSHTAETLLIREEKGKVVFLNRLRHKDNKALTFDLPVDTPKMPSAMTVRGYQGLVEGIDYQGMKVLAYTRKVPHTPWFLVSKVNIDEVYSEINRLFWIVSIIVGLFIVSITSGIGFIWNYRQSLQRRWTEQQILEKNRELEKNKLELEEKVKDRTAALQESYNQIKSLASYLQEVREEERKRISREIHDNLGQMVTALKMDVMSLSTDLDRLGPEERPAIDAKVKGIFDFIDNISGTVHDIAMELRPGILDHLGLSPAIEWQLQEFRKKTGLSYEFRVDYDIIIDRDISTAMFRIFQEALTNIVRHANATKVEVILEKNDGNLLMNINDNGSGFTEAGMRDQYALGLLGMKERANSFGGMVDIKGSEGTGTSVSVSVPIKG